MYRIYLLTCVINTFAFEGSDEAKYIDLLPESEKQEFLNRIARRILEEIQSKESPEQSQVEVTDDQLNAHDAYVQGLLKEESENHKNERRRLSDKEDNNYELNDKMRKEYNSHESSDNRHYIDLTLRTQKDGSNGTKHRRFNLNNLQYNDNIDANNNVPFNVIPVEVVYDSNKKGNKDGFNKNSTILSSSNKNIIDSKYKQKNASKNAQLNVENTYVTISSNEILKSHIDQDNYNVPTLKYPALQSLYTDIFSGEKSETTARSTGDVSKNVLTSKQKLDTSTTGILYNEERSKLANKINKITEITENNEKNEDSNIDFESTTPTINQNILNISNEISTFIPLTTEISIQSDQNNKNQQILLTSVEKSVTELPKTAHIKPSAKDHNKESPSTVIREKETANNAYKIYKDHPSYLRKRLHILSAEYNLEEPYKNKKEQKHENIKPNQYVVYEVSSESPTFVQQVDSKKVEPYYVPIYNFEPKNAYYDAHNNLGPNYDIEAKDIKKNSLNSNEDILDKELFSRSGFTINIEPKFYNLNRLIDKIKSGYFTEKINTPMYNREKYLLNNILKANYQKNNHQPHFDFDYYFDMDDKVRLNRDYINKGKVIQRNFKDYRLNALKEKYTPEFHMDYFDYFTDLRRRSKDKKAKNTEHKNFYNGGKLPDSNEEDHPYNSILKDNLKDHIRAVRKLLFRQQEYGFMSPTSFAEKVKPRRKAVFHDGLGLSDITTQGTFINGANTNNIAMDYYWGRVNDLNKAIGLNYDDIDFDDIKPENSNLKKIYVGKTEHAILKSIIDSLARSDDRLETSTIFEDSSDKFLDALTNVLKDMIHRNAASLISYDWLLSTVELRGALVKLLELIEKAENGKYIHPLDSQLLNYVVYLYDTSKKMLEHNKHLPIPTTNRFEDSNKTETYSPQILRKHITLPKSRQKKLGQKIKNPLNLWRSWYKYYVRILNEENNKNAQIIRNFKQFLEDIEDSLYDLHNAIKQIASITTFTNQNWYQDLKNIYLKSATGKQLLQVLLHLSTSKLFDSIEESTKKGAEDYIYYVKHNREALKIIQNEFVLVLRILKRLKLY